MNKPSLAKTDIKHMLKLEELFYNRFLNQELLNELIKRLNGGIVDPSFKVNWNHYKNCILLTQQNEFKSLNTKLYQIIEL